MNEIASEIRMRDVYDMMPVMFCIKRVSCLKKSLFALLLLFLVGIPMPLLALQDPNGFMGFTWGESIQAAGEKALARGMKPAEIMLKTNTVEGVSHLAYEGKILGYGGKLLLAFSNGKLFSAETFFEKRGGELFEKLAERFGEQYGEPEAYGSIFAPRWVVGNTLIVVSIDGEALVSLGSVNMSHLRSISKPDEPLTLEQLDRMFQQR